MTKKLGLVPLLSYGLARTIFFLNFTTTVVRTTRTFIYLWYYRTYVITLIKTYVITTLVIFVIGSYLTFTTYYVFIICFIFTTQRTFTIQLIRTTFIFPLTFFTHFFSICLNNFATSNALLKSYNIKGGMEDKSSYPIITALNL